MMKDSTIDQNWLREQMTKNPPSLRPNGDIFSGPVRLSFPNIFEPGKPGDSGGEGKYGAAILFPPGTDMALFEQTWTKTARAAFANNWTPEGKPVGLHLPFHDQADKAYSAKPLAGYTPGAIYFSATSKFKPVVVDTRLQPITDPAKVYPGVWAFVTMNVYSYKNLKTGVAFGLQQLMIIADDTKLGGGGGGNPKEAFAGVTITAQANVAAKFDQAPTPQGAAPAAAGIMPSGGHVGRAGDLPVHAIESEAQRIERETREMMGG